MALIDSLELGQFRPGTTPLHRLYPGLKLLGLPACVVAVFASSAPLQLLALALGALFLALAAGEVGRVWCRGVWQLRYLFLVTVVLHTLLSPGRTLLGTSWLSYDGLLYGVQVCAQLALAVVFSSLVTLTTSPAELVNSLTRFISPFRRWAMWPDELLRFLSLVLYFIPVLRQEGQRAWRQHPGRAAGQPVGLLARAGRAARLAEALVHGLLDRTDELARRMAGGEDVFSSSAEPPVDLYVRGVQLCWAVAGALWLALVFLGLR